MDFINITDCFKKIKTKYSSLKYITFCLIFVLGYVTQVQPLLGKNLEFIPGDFADARLNIYFLEHGYKWLAGSVASFWNAPFFFPVSNVISYSDNFLGSLPIYALFRKLGWEAESSFQLWVVAGVFFNYISIVWVLRKFKLSEFSVCVGAFVFTFSALAMVNFSHAQLIYRFPLPLAFYFLTEFLKKGGASNLIKLLSALLLQFYCSVYLGYFSALFLATYSFSYLLINRDGNLIFFEFIKKSAKNIWLYVIFLCFFAGLYILLAHYIQASRGGIGNTAESVMSMLPKFESYFLNASPNKLFGIAYSDISMPSKNEQIMYFGGLPILSLLYAIFHWRNVKSESIEVLALVSTMMIIIIMTLNFNGHSFYSILLKFPGISSIRAVSRVGLILLLPLSLITAFFVNKFLDSNKKTIFYKLIIILLTFIYLFENKLIPYHFSKNEAIARIKNITSKLSVYEANKTVLVYLNPNIGTGSYYLTEIDSMLAAQKIGAYTINGYSGRAPAGHRWLINSNDLAPAISAYKKSNLLNINAESYSYLLIYDVDKSIHSYYFNGFIDSSQHIQYAAPLIPPSNEFYMSEIKVLDYPKKINSSDKFYIKITVKNISKEVWRSDGANPVRLSYRWRTQGPSDVDAGFQGRVDFDHAFNPGDEQTITFLVTPPPKIHGQVYLDFDLVQENVTFFHLISGSITTVNLFFN